MTPEQIKKIADSHFEYVSGYEPAFKVRVWHENGNYCRSQEFMQIPRDDGVYLYYTFPQNTTELEQANKVLDGKCKELETDRDKWFAEAFSRKVTISDLTAKLEKTRVALDTAKTGLIWYMENTDQANGCDDDAMAQIDEALEGV